MKVLQTIYDLTARSGGPSTCVCDIVRGIADLSDIGECNCKVDLMTVCPQDKNDKNLGEGSDWLIELPYDYKTPLRISQNLRRALEESSYDIYHANTLWTDAAHSTCKYARSIGKKYILSPHGMLYPTALAISSWKKQIMLSLWFNRDISQATCLHATCKQEMEYCREFGFKGPIAVIPNAVVIPDGVELKKGIYCDILGRRQIGFLGRLHPIKKVENVIYALSMLSMEERGTVSFQIMGKYDECYEQWLREEVKRLDLEDCVDFVGFVSGSDKYERLAKLSALMVPSAQENFGMIVPEALLCGTPVYASFGTPWEELNESECGWWDDNSPATIVGVIRKILAQSDSSLLEMGRRGRMLVEEKYEQHKVATMMIELYKWILGKGIKPNFVYE